MKLIICEKPSLGKTVASAIGIIKSESGYIKCKNDYIVTYCFGHLLELKNLKDYDEYKDLKWKDYSLPVIPNFKYVVKDDSGIKKQIKVIKELFKDADEIINCGDADREGQIIIDNVINHINFKGIVKRLWLPDQTDESILLGLRNIKNNTEYINLQNEGYARTYLDWIYGINITIFLTNKTGKLLNSGRVLIPIVKFIYDRHKEIANFKKETYYQIESKTHNILLKVKEKYKNIAELEEKAKDLNNYKAKVINITEKKINKVPSKLFSLSKLQSELSKKYKIDFKSSLEIIQKLYEKGLLTYPRTNTEYLSENEFDKIGLIIDKLNNKGYNLKNEKIKRIYDDSKIESHSAITITGNLNAEGLDFKEQVVYKTVFNRFISNFLNEDTVVSEKIMKITVKDEEFNIKGTTVVNEGFFKYEPQEFKDKIPGLKVGEEFDILFESVEKETEPPKLITEAELSNLLKNPFKKEKQTEEDEYKDILEGVEIGTEATRTGIIEKAKQVGYIKQDKSNYDITELGISFIELLELYKINLFKEKSVELSKNLKKVYKGNFKIQDIIDIGRKELTELLNQDIESDNFKDNFKKSSGTICPKCKEGKILKGKSNYFCSKYKDGCNFKIWNEISSKKITEEIVKEICENKTTKLIKNFKSKKGEKYNGKLFLDENFEVKIEYENTKNS